MTLLHFLSQPVCVALVFAIIVVGWVFVELAYKRFGLGSYDRWPDAEKRELRAQESAWPVSVPSVSEPVAPARSVSTQTGGAQHHGRTTIP